MLLAFARFMSIPSVFGYKKETQSSCFAWLFYENFRVEQSQLTKCNYFT